MLSKIQGTRNSERKSEQVGLSLQYKAGRSLHCIIILFWYGSYQCSKYHISFSYQLMDTTSKMVG